MSPERIAEIARLAERLRSIIHGMGCAKESPNPGHPCDCIIGEAATALTALLAEREELLAVGVEMAVALHDFVLAGCPVCSGDCASANPSVIGCPIQRTTDTVRRWNRTALKGETP